MKSPRSRTEALHRRENRRTLWVLGQGSDSLAPARLPSIPRTRSATLDGETTRRASLNPDRGSGTLEARHDARKRQPQRETVKVARGRMAPTVIVCVIGTRRYSVSTTQNSPTVIGRIYDRCIYD